MKKINKNLILISSLGLLLTVPTLSIACDEKTKQRQKINYLEKIASEIEPVLKIEINKIEKLPSELSFYDFNFQKISPDVILRTEGPIIKDDLNGKITINYYFETKYVNGVHENKWIRTKTYSKTIEGFKTLYTDLNKEIDKLEIKINEKNKKIILPSEFIQVKTNFIFEKVSSEYKLINEYSYDNDKGIVKVISYYKNIKNNLDSKKIIKEFDGFDSNQEREIRNIKEKLNNLSSSTDLNNLLKVQKSNIKSSNITSKDFRSDFDTAKLVFDSLKSNDEKGTLQVIYYFKSKLKGFEYIQSPKKNIEITGFLTNALYKEKIENKTIKELDLLINKIDFKIEDKNSTTKIERLASSVLKEDLNINFSKNIDVNLKIKQMIPDDSKGILLVELILEKKNYEINKIVRSSTTKKIEIRGYKTIKMFEDSEKQRLDSLVKKIKDISLKNKNINNSFASEIFKDDFEVNINDSTVIEILEIKNVNDENGTLEIVFIVKSKDVKFSNIVSKKSKIIKSGFYKKSNYLNNLAEDLNNKIHANEIKYILNFNYEIDKTKTFASKILKENIEIKFEDSKFNYQNLQILSNDDNGTLTINFKIRFVESKFKQEIISSEIVIYEIKGFLTSKQDKQNKILKQLNDLINEENILTLKNLNDLENKHANEITSENFILNNEKQEKTVNVKFVILEIKPSDDGNLILKFYLEKQIDEFEKIKSNVKELNFKFLSKNQWVINKANNLKIKTIADDIKESIYTKKDMEAIFSNNEEIEKILGIYDFVKKYNLIFKLEKINFETINSHINTSTLVYKFVLTTNDGKINSKIFESKISIANVMTKRNLENYLNNSFEFTIKKEIDINYVYPEDVKNYEDFFNNNVKNKNEYIIDEKINELIKYSISSFDKEEGSVTVKVEVNYNEIFKFRNYKIKGFVNNTKRNQLNVERKSESKRLDDLLSTLTFEYEKNDSLNRMIDDIRLSDFKTNLDKKSYAEIFQKEEFIYNKNEGTITFKILLRSKKPHMKNIESSKIKTFTIGGFAKDKSAELNKLNEEYKKSSDYNEYKQKIYETLQNNKIDKALENSKFNKNSLIETVKKQYEKLTEEIEKTFLKSANDSINVFLQHSNNFGLIKKIYKHLNNMFTKTNDKLLNALLYSAKDIKHGGVFGLFKLKNIISHQIRSDTVGVWAKEIFKNIQFGIDDLNEFNEQLLNNLKERNNFIKFDETKFEKIKKLVNEHIKMIADYYVNIKWGYLIHGSGEIQPLYNNLGPGKYVSLTGKGWEILFNTEKFFVSKYLNKSEERIDLEYKINKMVESNDINYDEGKVLNKELKKIMSITTSIIDIYNVKIKAALYDHLKNALIEINDSK